MAATNREDLMAVTAKEYARLQGLIERIGPEVALSEDDEDTSIKDIVAHRAHWIGLFLGWYADGMAGREVHVPAEGYRWNELKRFNAQLRQAQADVGWDDARAMLDGAHAELLQFLADHTDAELYGGPMEGAHNDWTPGRWAEAAGPSHYRSAAKYIRARLRDA